MHDIQLCRCDIALVNVMVCCIFDLNHADKGILLMRSTCFRPIFYDLSIYSDFYLFTYSSFVNSSIADTKMNLVYGVSYDITPVFVVHIL